jgi:aminoglycoside/choline kinase family phosphotransferase
MILKDKEGIKSVGLLDFQDALIGSPAYDLVSLLEDARRDVADQVKSEMLEYFLSELEKKNLSTSSKEIIESFVKDFEILSLQRNLKILGIFARLSVRDGKNQYLQFLPRVKNLVLKRLSVSKIFDESFKKEIEQMI